jgi:hypothetical protein
VGLESKAGGSESRFAAYVEAITQALGHADRAPPFRSYCAGLLLPGDRKSVEPIVRLPINGYATPCPVPRCWGVSPGGTGSFKRPTTDNGQITAHSCPERMRLSLTARLPPVADRRDISATEDETPHGGAPALPEGPKP